MLFWNMVTHQQHKSALEAEIIRRISAFHKEIEQRDQSRDDVIHSAFLLLYWLAKEEVANKKFAALLEMKELLGLSNIKFFTTDQQVLHAKCSSFLDR